MEGSGDLGSLKACCRGLTLGEDTLLPGRKEVFGRGCGFWPLLSLFALLAALEGEEDLLSQVIFIYIALLTM